MKYLKTDIAMAFAVLVLGVALYLLGGTLLGEARDSSHVLALDRLIGLAASAIGMSVLAWWVISFGLALASEILSRCGLESAARRAGSFSPAFMRKLACAVLGFNLIAAPMAQADMPPTAGSSAVQQAQAGEGGVALSPLWVASKSSEIPVPQWQPAPLPSDGSLLISATRDGAPAAAAESEEIVVKPGDSLWTIVAKQLGPMASDAEVAEAWPLWYEANKQLIGAQPDVLLPGQVLHAPAGS